MIRFYINKAFFCSYARREKQEMSAKNWTSSIFAASLLHKNPPPRSLRGLDVGKEILHRDMSRSSWLRRHRLQVSRGINLAQLLDRHLLFLITVLLLLFSFHPTLLLLPFRLYHFLHLTILFHCLPSPNPPPPLGLPASFSSSSCCSSYSSHLLLLVPYIFQFLIPSIILFCSLSSSQLSSSFNISISGIIFLFNIFLHQSFVSS